MRLKESVMSHYISAAAQNDFSMITFVGGEPSLVPDLLRQGIVECKYNNLESAITTAPVWARTKESAEKFLDRIGSVDTIILSFDIYHLEQLTIEHYQNACIAAKNRSIKVIMNVCYSSEQERTTCVGLNASLKDMISQYLFQEIIPIGNARIVNRAIPFAGVTLESINDFDCLSKTCMAGNASVGLQFDLHACCWASAITRSPLCYRSREANLSKSIQSMQNDPAYQQLRKHGFIEGLGMSERERILSYCRGKTFVNECHLCMVLMGLSDQKLWRSIFLEKTINAS